MGFLVDFDGLCILLLIPCVEKVLGFPSPSSSSVSWPWWSPWVWMVPEVSLPIDAERLCFEPKFLSDEKSFDDLLDESTPDVAVAVSDAVLFTVNDEAGGTFGGEASVDDEDDEDEEREEDSSG